MILGAVTMGAAIAAAWFAREAARHTKDSVEATRIAAGPDISARANVFFFLNGEAYLNLLFTNHGLSTARFLHVRDMTLFITGIHFSVNHQDCIARKDVSPGQSASFRFQIGHGLNAAQLQALNNVVFTSGLTWDYRDTFGFWRSSLTLLEGTASLSWNCLTVEIEPA